jgi:hypothetical protein
VHRPVFKHSEDLGFERKEKKPAHQPRSNLEETSRLLDPKKARKVEKVHPAEDDVLNDETVTASSRKRTEGLSLRSPPPGSSPQSAIPVDSPESEDRKSSGFPQHTKHLHQVVKPSIQAATPTKWTTPKHVPSEIQTLYENERPLLPGLDVYDTTDDEQLSPTGPSKKKTQTEVKDTSNQTMTSKASANRDILPPLPFPKPSMKTEGASEIVTTLDVDLAQMADRTHLDDPDQDKKNDDFSPRHKMRSRASWDSMLNEPTQSVNSDRDRRSLAKVFQDTVKENSKRSQDTNADESQDELSGPPRSTIQPSMISRSQIRKAVKQTSAASSTGSRSAKQEPKPSPINPRTTRGRDLSHITEDDLEVAYDLTFFRTHKLELHRPDNEVLRLVYDRREKEFHAVCTSKDGYEYYATFDHKKVTKAVSDNNTIVRLTGPRSGRYVMLYDLQFEKRPYFSHFMETHMNSITGFTHQNGKSTRYMQRILNQSLEEVDDSNVAAVDDHAELQLLEARTQNRPQKGERERHPKLSSQLRGLDHGITDNPIATDSNEVPKTDSLEDAPLVTQLLASAREDRGNGTDLPPDLFKKGALTKHLKQVSARTQRITRATPAEIKAQIEPPKAPQSSFDQFPFWKGQLNISHGRTRAHLFRDELKRLDEDEWLNDSIIDFKLVWDMVNSRERAKSVFAFNSHFYISLTTLSNSNGTKVPGPINYDKVSKWTDKQEVDIFSYDYLLVPVVENYHWYLVLVCNVANIKRPLHSDEAAVEVPTGDKDKLPAAAEAPTGDEDKSVAKENSPVSEDPDAMELVDPHTSNQSHSPPRGILLTSPTKAKQAPDTSKSKKAIRDPDEPVILVLDSLGKTHPKATKCIKAYLAAEGKAKRQMDVDITSKPLYVKCIPQQDNASDCGIYVLAYIEKFMENPKAFVSKILSGEMDPVHDWPDLDAANLRSRLQTQLMRSGQLQDERRKQQHAGKKGRGKSGNPEPDSLSFLRMALEEMTADEQPGSHSGTVQPILPCPSAERNETAASIPPEQVIRDNSPKVVIPSAKSADSPKTPTSPSQKSPKKLQSTKRARSDDEASDTPPGSKSPRDSNESPHPQPARLPSVPSVKRRRSEDVSDEERRRAKSPKKGNTSPNPTSSSEQKPVKLATAPRLRSPKRTPGSRQKPISIDDE